MPVLLLSPKLWGAIALCAVVGLVYYAGGIGPRGEVSVLEEKESARVRAVAVQAGHDLKNKERTNEENRRSHAALQRELDRLRAIPVGAIAPAPASSKCPEGQICFDSAEFDAARGRFYTRVREVAGQCTALAIDLDSARDWANGN